MRFKLLPNKIIDYGSIKQYDVHKEHDLIELVSDLNEYERTLINLKNEIIQKNQLIEKLKSSKGGL